MSSSAEAWSELLEQSEQTRHAQPFKVPTSAIIDVSRPQTTRAHRALSLFANIVLAILLVLAFPLVLTAVGLPLVWLVRAAARLVVLFELFQLTHFPDRSARRGNASNEPRGAVRFKTARIVQWSHNTYT